MISASDSGFSLFHFSSDKNYFYQVDSTADLVGTSLQVVKIPLSCSTAPTPQIEEVKQ